MRKLLGLAMAGLFVLMVLAITRPSLASEEPGGITATGGCTGDSEWELHMAVETGLDLELGIESGVPSQVWKVVESYDGQTIFKGKIETDEDGGFENRRIELNRPDEDTFRVKAVNTVTGEVCEGSLQAEL
jgi:hypothetical protein